MANEKRLIDANRLLRDPYFQEDRYPESRLLRMAIREQHTVEAVEVVHGRWMEFNSFMTCSECDKDFYYADNNCDEFDYCPNCGAKMDGDGNG